MPGWNRLERNQLVPDLRFTIATTASHASASIHRYLNFIHVHVRRCSRVV